MARPPRSKPDAGAVTSCTDSPFAVRKRDKDENARPNDQAPRVIMDFPKNFPITQIEIEVIAALLDDCESLFSDQAETQEQP